MGMTDRQFDSYLKSHLRELKRALEEVKRTGGNSEILESIIKDLEEELKRP